MKESKIPHLFYFTTAKSKYAKLEDRNFLMIINGEQTKLGKIGSLSRFDIHLIYFIFKEMEKAFQQIGNFQLRDLFFAKFINSLNKNLGDSNPKFALKPDDIRTIENSFQLASIKLKNKHV